ncbi:18674_t:CDS:1, partial [Dentiscutata erythropus]
VIQIDHDLRWDCIHQNIVENWGRRKLSCHNSSLASVAGLIVAGDVSLAWFSSVCWLSLVCSSVLAQFMYSS